MTIEETLRKADLAIDMIVKYDQENIDCSFKTFLKEVLERWRSQN